MILILGMEQGSFVGVGRDQPLPAAIKLQLLPAYNASPPNAQDVTPTNMVRLDNLHCKEKVDVDPVMVVAQQRQEEEEEEVGVWVCCFLC